METVSRIGIRRTQAVDDLLKGIWALRPELECKNTTTILLGLESFLRECKVHARIGYSSPVTIDAASENESSVAEPGLVAVDERDSAVSDDIEW
jgi:hypothetical protein